MKALNKRTLWLILKNDSNYSQLLQKTETATLCNKRFQKTLFILFKSPPVILVTVGQRLVNSLTGPLYFDNYPKYLKDLFVLRCKTYSLTGKNIFSIPKPYSTSYGLRPFKFLKTKPEIIYPTLAELYQTSTNSVI